MKMSYFRRVTAAILSAAAVVSLLAFSDTGAMAVDDSKSKRIMVSIGDSFSAGEGIEPFFHQDDPIDDKVHNQDWLAHRSENCWSGMLRLPEVEKQMKDHRDTNWYFVASSGAETRDMLGAQEKEYIYFEKVPARELSNVLRELKEEPIVLPELKPSAGSLDIFFSDPYYSVGYVGIKIKEKEEHNDPQLEKIKRLYGKIDKEEHIDPQLEVFKGLYGKVDYVTMTLGGNDAGFTDVVTEGLFAGEYLYGGLTSKINAIWKEYLTGNMRENIRKSYAGVVNSAGPQARIIVAGYPQLVNPKGGPCFNKAECTIMNTAVHYFNRALKELVNECADAGMNIHFVSVEEKFLTHGAYAPGEGEEGPWINGVEIPFKAQDINQFFPPVSAASFHPNFYGACAYRDCVQNKIDELEENPPKTSENGILMGCLTGNGYDLAERSSIYEFLGVNRGARNPAIYDSAGVKICDVKFTDVSEFTESLAQQMIEDQSEFTESLAQQMVENQNKYGKKPYRLENTNENDLKNIRQLSSFIMSLEPGRYTLSFYHNGMNNNISFEMKQGEVTYLDIRDGTYQDTQLVVPDLNTPKETEQEEKPVETNELQTPPQQEQQQSSEPPVVEEYAQYSELFGVYTGTYQPSQGETALTLTVFPQDHQVKAIFDFYNLPGRTNSKSGFYTMNVTKEGEQFVFTSDEWIVKPEQYYFVDLKGTLDNDTLSGTSPMVFNLKRVSHAPQINCYEVFDVGIDSWADAQKYCASLGGHLATLSSREENAYVYYLMKKAGYDSAYFGFTDGETEDKWVWINGETSSYTNWHSGEPNQENPNEDYAMFYYKYSDATWNDGDFNGDTVNGGQTFICEWEDYEAYRNYMTPQKNAMMTHSYQLFEQAMTWTEAERFCETQGGYLAVITSAEEQRSIEQLLQSQAQSVNYWIGGYRSPDDDNWAWVTGEFFRFENWDVNQPDNKLDSERYLRLVSRDVKYSDWNAYFGKWNDTADIAGGDSGEVPLNSFGFICEWDSEIVD